MSEENKHLFKEKPQNNFFPVFSWAYQWFFIELLVETESLCESFGSLKLYSKTVNRKSTVLVTLAIKENLMLPIPLHYFNAYCFAPPPPKRSKKAMSQVKQHWQGRPCWPEEKCVNYPTLPDESKRCDSKALQYEIKLTLADMYEKLTEENPGDIEFYFEPVPLGIGSLKSSSTTLPVFSHKQLNLCKLFKNNKHSFFT